MQEVQEVQEISVKQIFDELNESNSGNYKKGVLAKYKDHEQLQWVLKMTYDHVEFTYGVSLQNVLKFTPTPELLPVELEVALKVLAEDISTGHLTGHAALQSCADLISALSDDDAHVFKRIIDRNIKCNIGRSPMLKVWPGLITKQIYMRCGTYNDKTSKKIKLPAIIQMKADGTYRELTVNDTEVSAKSRSGESYDYPVHFELMQEFSDGVYTGELTVRCSDEIIEEVKAQLQDAIKKGHDTELYEEVIETYAEKKVHGDEYILPRSIGNGIINSSKVPHENLILDLWDFIDIKEYKNAGLKIKNSTPYEERLKNLQDILALHDVNDNIREIEGIEVNTIQEALQQVSVWMSAGFEGGVLKNKAGLFRDGTSPDQLKLKLCIDAEMRILEFSPGRIGTAREGKVGAIIFGNDEGTIKGRASGFSNELMDDMTVNPDKYLQQIMTVQFNDLSRARGNDYYALSHPRFMEIRNDKDETDTLEKCFELRAMAMCLEEAAA
jgi:hypothetical protein